MPQSYNSFNRSSNGREVIFPAFKSFTLWKASSSTSRSLRLAGEKVFSFKFRKSDKALRISSSLSKILMLPPCMYISTHSLSWSYSSLCLFLIHPVLIILIAERTVHHQLVVLVPKGQGRVRYAVEHIRLHDRVVDHILENQLVADRQRLIERPISHIITAQTAISPDP